MTGFVPSPVVLPRKEGRVRSDEVETLDVVGGADVGSQQGSQRSQDRLPGFLFSQEWRRRDDRVRPGDIG